MCQEYIIEHPVASKNSQESIIEHTTASSLANISCHSTPRSQANFSLNYPELDVNNTHSSQDLIVRPVNDGVKLTQETVKNPLLSIKMPQEWVKNPSRESS